MKLFRHFISRGLTRLEDTYVITLASHRFDENLKHSRLDSLSLVFLILDNDEVHRIKDDCQWIWLKIKVHIFVKAHSCKWRGAELNKDMSYSASRCDLKCTLHTYHDQRKSSLLFHILLSQLSLIVKIAQTNSKFKWYRISSAHEHNQNDKGKIYYTSLFTYYLCIETWFVNGISKEQGREINSFILFCCTLFNFLASRHFAHLLTIETTKRGLWNGWNPYVFITFFYFHNSFKIKLYFDVLKSKEKLFLFPCFNVLRVLQLKWFFPHSFHLPILIPSGVALNAYSLIIECLDFDCHNKWMNCKLRIERYNIDQAK